MSAKFWFDEAQCCNFGALTWKCSVCGEERTDEFISVQSFDVSGEMGLPPGHAHENVRHCNDRLNCIENAENARSWNVSVFAR